MWRLPFSAYDNFFRIMIFFVEQKIFERKQYFCEEKTCGKWKHFSLKNALGKKFQRKKSPEKIVEKRILFLKTRLFGRNNSFSESNGHFSLRLPLFPFVCHFFPTKSTSFPPSLRSLRRPLRSLSSSSSTTSPPSSSTISYVHRPIFYKIQRQDDLWPCKSQRIRSNSSNRNIFARRLQLHEPQKTAFFEIISSLAISGVRKHTFLVGI